VQQADLQKPSSAQTDWGGTLGGPIIRDTMHFFYSLDRIVYEEGRSNTFAARTLAARHGRPTRRFRKCRC
jgi:hypothetical protein